MQNRKRDRCLWYFSGKNTGVSRHFPTPGDLPHLGIKLLRAKIYKAVHYNLMNYFSVSSVQFSCSVVSDSLWSYGLEHARLSCSSPIPGACSYTCPFEPVMPSNHLILSRPLLLLPSIFPSIRVFSNESVLHIRWPKYWSFSFSISPSNEHPGLISFRMDWLDLLAVQGTLKSSPTTQFKTINSSMFSFLYSPTLASIHDYWKNHSLD